MTSPTGSQHVPRGGTARRRSGRRSLRGALACLVLVAGFLSGLRPAQGEPDPEGAPPPASDEKRAAGPTHPVVEALCHLWETKDWKPLDAILAQGDGRLDDWLDAILTAPWPPSDRPAGTEPSLAADYLATSVFGRVQDREDPRIRTVVDLLVQAALAADPPAQLRALCGLGPLGVVRAEEVTRRLLPLFDSEDAQVRTALLQVLARYGPEAEAAHDTLRELMKNAAPVQRLLAASALVRGGHVEEVLAGLPEAPEGWSEDDLRALDSIRTWAQDFPPTLSAGPPKDLPPQGQEEGGPSGRYLYEETIEDGGERHGSGVSFTLRTTLDLRPDQSFSMWVESLWIFEDPCDRFWSVREGTWSPAPDGSLRLDIGREDGKPARKSMTAIRTGGGLTLLGKDYSRLGKDALSTPAR